MTTQKYLRILTNIQTVFVLCSTELALSSYILAAIKGFLELQITIVRTTRIGNVAISH